MSRQLFSQSAIDELLKARNEVIYEIAKISKRATLHRYVTDLAREHGLNGFARRLRTISRAVERIFELVPPYIGEPPSREDRIDAEAYLQALIIATYGASDNLATIWVNEINLSRDDGRPLPDTWIGLRPNNTIVRESLPLPIQERLNSFDGWFAQLENYRHALAHRIPFYIPPYSVAQDKIEKYNEIEAKKYDLLGTGNLLLIEEMEAKQKEMEFFQPLIVHSWGEKSRPVVFHEMTIVAARTVNEMGKMVFDSLESRSA